MPKDAEKDDEEVVLEGSKMWRGVDDKTGKVLFTQVPNALMTQIISGGTFGLVEIRIIALICRASWGFRREETYYMGTEDFVDAMGIKKPHLSTALNKLLSEGSIFRGKESGGKHKYALNLLSFGCPMKCYKLVDDGYVLGEGEYALDKKSYVFRNHSLGKGRQIIYKPSGFDATKKPYIKKDTKLDKKINNASSDSSSSVGATETEAFKINSETTIVKKHKEEIDRHARLEELLKEFEELLMKCSVLVSVDVMLKYMRKLSAEGFSAGDISIRYCEICQNKQTNLKGEKFNVHDWNIAIAKINEEERQGIR